MTVSGALWCDAGAVSVPLREFGVIYFGNDWFAENRTSSHHVAEHLAQRTRVLYIDVPGLRAPKANGRDLRKLYRRLTSAARPPRSIADNLWQISVPQIPFRRLPLVRRLNAAIGRFLVRQAMKRLGFGRPVSWFAVPHAGLLANAFGEAAVIYYCIDDYAALPDVDTAIVAEMDAHLSRSADQIFVASSRMLEDKLRLNRSTAFAPHGVDVALFRLAADPQLPVADAVRDLEHPVIGFFGLIEEWIDLELIAGIAARRPEWTFLMIGRLAVNPGRLKGMSNVRFVGPQPYRSLPSWAKAFDVAIIPYRLTRQVVNSAPLKLREYLATGKPVVSVATPEVVKFAGLVRIATGTEQFIRQIEAALSSDTEWDRLERIETASSMSWDVRIQEVVEIVERKLWHKDHDVR